MIDRSEVVVHLVLGDEGRYVGGAFSPFPFPLSGGSHRPSLFVRRGTGGSSARCRGSIFNWCRRLCVASLRGVRPVFVL
jgi:hypothetical protein